MEGRKAARESGDRGETVLLAAEVCMALSLDTDARAAVLTCGGSKLVLLMMFC